MENFDPNQATQTPPPMESAPQPEINPSGQGSAGGFFQNKKNLILIGVVVIALIVISIVGSAIRNSIAKRAASNFLENQIEKSLGGNANVDIDKNGVQVKTKEGELVVNSDGVSVPDSCPKELSSYPDAKVIMAICSGKAGEGSSLTMETSDSGEAVQNYYKGKLTGDGWANEGATSFSGVMGGMYKKGNATIQITTAPSSEDSSKTTIMASFSIMTN